MSKENQPTEITVSAVIPCLNEEETIGIVVKKAIESFRELNVAGEVVVADNGSTDRSVEIAESLGARVVYQEKLKGYGAALMAGIEGARGKYIIMGDADDSYDFSLLGPFIERLEDGADLVMGNRFAGGILPGAMPFLHRYFGNPLFSFMARTASGAPVGDFYCGMRGFTRAMYDRLNMRSLGMVFAIEMVISAARADFRIDEIPIKLHQDKRTKPPHLRTFRDGWRTLRFIMTNAPNYLYMVPGLFLFIVGLLLQAALITGPIRPFGFYMGIHFLALGSLFSLIGFNIISLGILARTIVARQNQLYQDEGVKRLLTYFTVEAGLIGGGLLTLAGFAVDATLLWRRIMIGGSMVDSYYIVFVATSALAIGISVMFLSFLLNLLIPDGRENVADPS